MLRLITALSLSLFTALSLATPAAAFENENLLVAVLKCYKPEYRASNARGFLIPGGL
jgi:hypothetical protein